MALELKQSLRLLQQAIKLLQLSRLELVDLIRSEMEQNPLLEEPQDGAEAELNEAPAELVSTLSEDIDWERYLDNYQTQHTAPSGGGFNSEDLPSIESTLTRAQGLTERLMEQLRMAGLTEQEERIGALIIGNLNRDGYLVVDPDLQPDMPAFEAEPQPVDPEKPVEV